MDKEIREYKNKYGDISVLLTERISDLLKDIKNKKDLNILERCDEIQQIKWSTVSFCIYLEPKATPRPRGNMHTKIFYVKGAKNNKKRFGAFIEKQNINMIITPTKFDCSCFFPIPKSMKKTDKILAELGFIRPISKPDWDNLGKTYSDMIQEKLLYDDSLIIDGRVRKFYSSRPRIEITLTYMNDFDSKYNENKIKKG